MSGHSKWANIKHRKGRQDAIRGKMFTRVIKEITVAVKEGGTDPDSNSRLRLALQNARSVNMPKDTVERAIHKASGADADDFTETTYEGYAPNGIPVVVECTTDNLNRTVQNVRSIFSKYGGNLGTNGSVDYMFERKGVFTLKNDGSLNEDDFTLEIIDGGAEDVEFGEELLVVTCAMGDFGNLQKKLDEIGVEIESGELQRIPSNPQTLDDDKFLQVMKFIDAMEEDEDVVKIFHGMDVRENQISLLE
jgi:YebC/PmpR family DNA-binding regulatory protein